MKCAFYDDGCGNGGYCSGMNAGPPSCNLFRDLNVITCSGNTKKCNKDGSVAEQRTEAITSLESAIKGLRTKI